MLSLAFVSCIMHPWLLLSAPGVIVLSQVLAGITHDCHEMQNVHHPLPITDRM